MRSVAVFVLLCCSAVLAACDPATTGPEPQQRPLGPLPPMQALASSANECPTRCFIPINTGLSETAYLRNGNEEARVVGHAGTAGGFVWTAKTGTVLLPPGGGGTEPLNLNSWGQVVGHVGTTASVWEPSGTRYDISHGVAGPAVLGRATAISDHSVIVGESDGRGFRTSYSDGFQWLTAAGTRSAAVDINFNGQIVGWYEPTSGSRRPFLWTPGAGLRDLGLLPGYTSGEAVAISETGIVVGFDVGPSGRRGFMWTAAGGKVPLIDDFRPWDVNHWGEIAGTNMDGTQCFVWYEGYGKLRLPDNGHKTCYVKSINSWGDVVGGLYDSFNREFQKVPGAPGVWTWSDNRYRYRP